MTAPIVFLDTETTGLHPDARVWEVAGIRREPDGTETVLHRFVESAALRLREADLFALNLGRFHERHPNYRAREVQEVEGDLAVPESWVADVVEEFTRGAVLVGSNPAFDAAMLTALLARHDLRPTWQYRVVDVAALAAGWLQGVRHEAAGDLEVHAELLTLPWRSEALAAACGVPPAPEEDRHTAMGDVRWVQRWWDVLHGAEAAL